MAGSASAASPAIMSDPGQAGRLPIKLEVCQNSLWNGSQVKGGALATTLWKKLRSPVRERSEQGRRRTP